MAAVELSSLAEAGTGGKAVIGTLFYYGYVCGLDCTLRLTNHG